MHRIEIVMARGVLAEAIPGDLEALSSGAEMQRITASCPDAV